MTIALTGSTGKIGKSLLAAAGDLSIRALARKSFDFLDRATWSRSLEGAETLVLVSPVIANQEETFCAFIDAARAAGVKHVVKLSGAGADHASTRFAAQHRVVEGHLRESGLGWTLVRPTFFMENMLGIAPVIASGTYPAPTGQARMTQVAVADIAAVLLAVARDPAAHRSAIYTLTAPAALSGEEIARVLSEAVGHAVRYVDVPEEAFRENLLRAGLDAWTADGVIEGYRKVRAGEASEATSDITRVLGRPATDFATWAKTAFRK